MAPDLKYLSIFKKKKKKKKKMKKKGKQKTNLMTYESTIDLGQPTDSCILIKVYHVG